MIEEYDVVELVEQFEAAGSRGTALDDHGDGWEMEFVADTEQTTYAVPLGYLRLVMKAPSRHA